MKPRHALVLSLGVALALFPAAMLLVRLTADTGELQMLGGFSTSLRDRTPSQRHNALLAARALDGTIVRPSHVFSFNRAVRSWTFDRGYRKAPVSNEGELIRAFGGGVCQTSSTLYNAVLLAGLRVVERHRHAVAPRYTPPGRDAAVAQNTLDFRFANDTAHPIRILAGAEAGMLTVRLYSGQKKAGQIALVTRILSEVRPARYVLAADQSAEHRTRLRATGATGWRVVTYRVYRRDGSEAVRERISDDTYRAVDRVDRPDTEVAGPAVM